MKHLAQWLVDSVWQIADRLFVLPGVCTLDRNICGEVSLVGRKGKKEVARSPNRVLLESLG